MFCPDSMPTNLCHITLWNLLSFFIFLGFLWGVNAFAAPVDIPFDQIVAASALFGFFYVLLFAATWLLLVRRWVYRFAGVVLLALGVGLVVWGSYPLIYDWLPRLGIHFQPEDVDFTVYEFRRRMLTSFVFVWILAAGMVYLCRYMIAKRTIRRAYARRDEYKASVERLQARLESRHFAPHTIENVVAITMGRLTMDNREEHLHALMVLAEVMHYALRMQDDEATVTLAEEWEQVENMAVLGQVCHGRGSVELAKPSVLPDCDLPIGVLVMPMENALKYATITADTPVRIGMEGDGQQWRFTVTNHFRQAKRSTIRSGKTGFALLQRKIDGGAWPISVHRREQEDTFWVSLVGKFR